MSRTVLVTGAAKGIGRAIALGLAERGYDIAINDIPSEQAGLTKVSEQIAAMGLRTLVVPADISAKDQVQDMVATVVREWDVLDVLVNNAGLLTVSTVEDLPEETWDKVFDVNAKGTFLVSQAAIPHMKARHEGRIIHIASIGGKQGAPGQAHYCAYGVLVNAVCPGIILTEMGRNNLKTQENIDKWSNATALRRLGEPEDVVGPVAFFASADSGYITGQSLNVCGGIIFY